MPNAIATDSHTDIANDRHKHKQRHSYYHYSPSVERICYVPSRNGHCTMKTIEETRLVLDQVAYYDHRTTDPKTLDQWHHALMRVTIEHAFDAVHDHYEHCDQATASTLTAGHVLEHVNRTRRAREDAERRDRQRERDEAVFDQLTDHRDEATKQRSLTAMHAGRAHIDSILEQRRDTA